MDEQGVPSLTCSLLKRIEDSQVVVSSNGHNAETVGVVPRTKSIGEILQGTEELPDTVLISPVKDEQEMVDREDEQTKSAKEEDAVVDTENHEKTKSPKTEALNLDETRDMFDVTAEEGVPSSKTESDEKEHAKREVEEPQEEFSLKLQVTESQFCNEGDTSLDSSKENDKVDNTEMEIKLSKVTDDAKDTPPKLSSSKVHATPVEPATSDYRESSQSSKVGPRSEEPCCCDPSCHTRVQSVSERLKSVCSQLGDFISMKKRVENPDLSRLLTLLTSIESTAQNKSRSSTSPMINEVFYANSDSGPTKKKNTARPRNGSATPRPVEKITVRTDIPIVIAEEKFDFQDIKGLAVFAKWPNSGWYYPGVVEGLSPPAWKESTNVTVTFYDGLVREMKNINILPANLIPPGVILCDLDDETEMSVNSTKIIEDNNVEFKLSLKGDPKTFIDAGFNRLAIKATHMKSIKQLLEATIDVVPKKMHMVSLDNLVSGRRSRVRTCKEDGEEMAADTPRKGTRKSGRKTTDLPTDEEMDDDASLMTTPIRKRSASSDLNSTSKRQPKRARQ